MRVVLFTIFLCTAAWAHASDWDDQIGLYLDAYEQSAARPQPVAYPRLGDRVKNVFLSRKKSHVIIERQNNDELEKASELFYSSGELHILQHVGGWNMVTEGDFIYEWEVGAKTGFRLRKNEKDLVDFILYMTDPSYIMTSLYSAYTRNPDTYNVVEGREGFGKELVLKTPRSGFEALFVKEEPLWFHGFRMANSKRTPAMSVYFAKPAEYNVLPAELLEAMQDIEFSESNQTIRRHMTYL